MRFAQIRIKCLNRGFERIRRKSSTSSMPAGFEGVGWRLSYEGHSVDALALRGEEGRSRLRKAPASCQANCDPEMSEWGNPAV